MFRPHAARLHRGHGSPPHFGERFRIVKITNTPYHQYQLAYIRSPDVRLSAECKHRGYSYGPIFIKGASHHFGALTKPVEQMLQPVEYKLGTRTSHRLWAR